ncbi:ribonuclease domain-containing protein, partial [Gluconacetobacter asukensis]
GGLLGGAGKGNASVNALSGAAAASAVQQFNQAEDNKDNQDPATVAISGASTEKSGTAKDTSLTASGGGLRDSLSGSVDPVTGVDLSGLGTGSSVLGGSGQTNVAAGTNNTSGTTPMVNGVTVVDQKTGAVYQGTVDLQPTLDRIANGEKYPSRNDGSTFNNNEGRLPQEPAGYYKEYVVPTPGIKGVGPQRIVTGQNGETYYTPDHYKTFIFVKR